MSLKVFTLWLIASATSRLVEAADANTVLADIRQIGLGVVALNTSTTNVQPGFSGLKSALQVQQDAVALDKQVIQATADANASPPFFYQSPQISYALINSVANITSTLNNTQRQNSTFGDFRPVVLASLYQLKQDTDSFGRAIQAKLEPFEAAFAPVILKQIDDAFNKAIMTYGGTRTYFSDSQARNTIGSLTPAQAQ